MQTDIQPLNLLRDAWLPVRRLSGARAVIRPAQLTEGLEEDPVVALDWPRPDFRIASLELLVGLLATAFPPGEAEDWVLFWECPPSPDTLDAAFAPFAHAFELDGDGPRFLQDFEDLPGGAEPVERLLIDTPGEDTLRKNTDLLVKRGRAEVFARSTAAIALFTLQSWAPEGGRGYRVGLRGGGPLTTLVVPAGPDGARPPTLWHLLWVNVPLGRTPSPTELPKVFPWLAPTITSETGLLPVTPVSSHPLQAFWGMPRRIRLEFRNNASGRACDLTARVEPVLAVGRRERNYGTMYQGWSGKEYPLTPFRRKKLTEPYRPVHPQADDMGYRHWLGLIVEVEGRAPARCVQLFVDRAAAVSHGASRLLAAGYDMRKKKARGFVEAEMPLPALADRKAREALDALARALVLSAETVAGLLQQAIRGALFEPGAKADLQASLFASARERFWQSTEPAFFDMLAEAGGRLAADAGGATADLRERWRIRLRDAAVAEFDRTAPVSPDGEGDPERILRARRFLGVTLAGRGKGSKELFTLLGLPLPEPKKADRRNAA